MIQAYLHCPVHNRRNETYFIHPLLLRVWGQHGYQKKQIYSGMSIFLVWCALFLSKLNKLQNCPKTLKKQTFFSSFSKFILFWLKNSAIWQQIPVPWSFLLLSTPQTFPCEDLYGFGWNFEQTSHCTGVLLSHWDFCFHFFQIHVIQVSKSQNILSKVHNFIGFYTWFKEAYIRLDIWYLKDATRGRFSVTKYQK